MRKGEKWFINRIGKRIYRYTDTHCCKHCQDAYENGFIISDKSHALYVYACQNEMGLVYNDKPMKQKKKRIVYCKCGNSPCILVTQEKLGQEHTVEEK